MRAIISSEEAPDPACETVRFSLKRNKVLLFSPEGGEERIPFGGDGAGKEGKA